MGIALSPMNYSFHWFKRIKSVKKLLIKILHVKKKNQFGAEGSLGIDYFMPLKNNGSTPFVLNFQRKKKELSTESIPQTIIPLPSPPQHKLKWSYTCLSNCITEAEKVGTNCRPRRGARKESIEGFKNCEIQNLSICRAWRYESILSVQSARSKKALNLLNRWCT